MSSFPRCLSAPGDLAEASRAEDSLPLLLYSASPKVVRRLFNSVRCEPRTVACVSVRRIVRVAGDTAYLVASVGFLRLVWRVPPAAI